MKCPFCGNNDTRVIDSRPLDDAMFIRRRRECSKCLKRFSTQERIEEMPLMVVKSDNRREQFDRNKLRDGLLHSCEKRPISVDVIEKIVSEVEYELQNYVMEVPSKVIGKKVLEKLMKIDPVAYIRFASVHRQFQDIETFMKELRQLKRQFDKRTQGADSKTK
jgi:transcriptional repressor NrdR